MNPQDALQDLDTRYPAMADLRNRAYKRMPKFAFEYLDGGCNEDVNLDKNTSDIQQVELEPRYLTPPPAYDISTTLFGETYSAPFGVAPVGLQGLMWPNSPIILAKAARRHNVPFCLSTVTTASIEQIAEVTEGKAWFQLYYPAENEILFDIMDRARSNEYKVFVALADVPTFGYRPRDIRNGLAMPPKMTLANILQMFMHPTWACNSLRYGKPNFNTMKKYMDRKMNLKEIGKFMNATFNGRLNLEKLKVLRDRWDGKLVVKGIVNESDCEEVIKLGIDGIIVSNHGGRQLDAGQSTIVPLAKLVEKYKDKLTIMMDSGIRSGPDIARTIATGADFTFMGRSFMYGVGALGSRGGNHVMAMMKRQLQQVLEQLGCPNLEELPSYLIKESTD
ncbi:MAG: alpha-hydroxy-acid oxidizing enzyme [Planctomycetaceae bacterium]|nr:alpha-hydroxy-acid oxidizing enzyme [Planctomycetaceae bacterium]